LGDAKDSEAKNYDYFPSGQMAVHFLCAILPASSHRDNFFARIRAKEEMISN
jgi:hypothetical protein